MYQLRSRLVSFRVSEQELERLKNASALQGARCLSDFARNATLGSVRGQSPPVDGNQSMDAVLARFERRLSALEAGLERLASALGHRVGTKAGD